MSVDTVDDLHAAEEAASSFAFVAAGFVTRIEAFDEECTAAEKTDTSAAWQLLHAIAAELRSIADRWAAYCRPSCGAEGDPTSDECGDDSCGCPCSHRDPAAS